MPDFNALLAHKERLRNKTIAGFYQDDAERDASFSASLADICLFYGRHALDKDALDSLLEVAEKAGLAAKRTAFFNGDIVNKTEQRPALHMALRANKGDSYSIDGQDVVADVLFERERMLAFAEKLRSGSKMTDIVHIGIGGSALGPYMASRALDRFADDTAPHIHFCSNVDPEQITGILKKLQPETTLFLIASKTFTTSETIANAHIARDWITTKLGADAVSSHFVALSSNYEAASAFGIKQERIFPFADWVGGRFSLWSSIGLPLAIKIGSARFKEFLAGAKDADIHFREAEPAKNIPVLMGLLAIWHSVVSDTDTMAILPYSSALAHLPAYLQQLEMESNGKSVSQNGEQLAYKTAPIVFGAVGTDCQHSFLQMFHQGTCTIPADLIAVLKTSDQHQLSQNHLLANLLAQSAALLTGREHKDPNAVLAGNRPHSILTITELTPRNLGKLIALYEHAAIVRGFIWDINSFDQPGVELGKMLTAHIEPLLENTPVSTIQNFTKLLKQSLKLQV